MRVVITFKPSPRPSPHKPNLSPCPPCGCWVSFCSLKRSPSSKAQRAEAKGWSLSSHTWWKPSPRTEHDHGHTATLLAAGEKGAEKTPALKNEWPLYRSASSVHIHTYIESHQELPASTLGATKSAVHGTRVLRFQTKVCLPHLWHLTCANRKQTDSFPRAVPSCTESLAEWNRDSTGISILQSPTQRLKPPNAARGADQSSCRTRTRTDFLPLS